MQDNKNFLGTEPVGKLLLKLSIPTVIAQLINIADSGRLFNAKNLTAALFYTCKMSSLRYPFVG